VVFEMDPCSVVGAICEVEMVCGTAAVEKVNVIGKAVEVLLSLLMTAVEMCGRLEAREMLDRARLDEQAVMPCPNGLYVSQVV
jgi:hypothetical protein